MHYTVHIKPSGYNLSVKASESILTAALRQGYQFPHDCENGVCGTCKGKLIEGQVEYDETILPGLTEEEREAGYALFCSAKPLSDLIIQMDGVIGPEQLPIKKLTYTVQTLQQLTATIYQAILLPPADEFIAHHAGQYIEILHRDASPRPFSIANAPVSDNKQLEFHIRYQPDNPYTAELLHAIQTTGQLRLKGPFGSCILRREPDYPMILVAGGTGFAPAKALIEQALAEGTQQPIYLYWGVRKTDDFYMSELVERWVKYCPNFHFIPVLSGKNAGEKWRGRHGWVHEAVLQDHPDLSRFHVYASGPTEMVFAALHAFKLHNLNRALMYSDALDYPLV